MKKFFILFCLALTLYTLVLNGQNKVKRYEPQLNNKHQTTNIKQSLFSDTIDVLHYDIHLNIVHLSLQEISGYTELTITPKMNNVLNIPLYLQSLTVDSILIDEILTTNYTHDGKVLNITALQPINIGDTINVKIFYHGHPDIDPSGWGGFYFSSDSAYAYNLGVGFLDNPHNYGRVWFPCIDDFIDRDTYDFYIRVNQGKMAVCAGTLISSTDNGDGTFTYHWKLNNEIPTYLASVAVGNYSVVNDIYYGITDTIPISIYVPPAYVSNVNGTFVNLKNILNIYETHFGPYLWERIGYTGIPFNSGAMEHATNIFVPNICITGNLIYEDLFAHELFHHWFGNLVTCESAEEMWLNEGWATYGEAFYQEFLYGKTIYKDYVRNNHLYVLQKAHIEDNGYLTLYGIPHELTYGTTVYKKGADVVHTLRNYIGDDKFFNGITAFLDSFKFRHISSIDLKNFLSQYTGIDLNDFFTGWVFSPGFPHFSIDSFKVVPDTLSEHANVTVHLRQQLNHAPNFFNSNKITLTFMNDNWQTYTDTIFFDGEFGDSTFTMPLPFFAPSFVMLDFDELISDAITDYYDTIKTTGVIEFPTTFFKLDVQTIGSDSAFIRVEHNWVPPDSLKSPSPFIFRLSDYRYWKVDGIFPDDFYAKGRFTYNRTNYLDNTFLPLTTSVDSLALLYRRNTSDDWQLTQFTRFGGTSVGYLSVDTLKQGEYTLAIIDPNVLSVESPEKTNISLKIYPNPSDDTFNIYPERSEGTSNSKNESLILKIYNSTGKEVFSKNIRSKSSKITWQPKNLPCGSYIIKVVDRQSKTLARGVAIYVK